MKSLTALTLKQPKQDLFKMVVLSNFGKNWSTNDRVVSSDSRNFLTMKKNTINNLFSGHPASHGLMEWNQSDGH